MTGGWAATNTLREALNDAIQNRTYGVIIEHDPMCAAIISDRSCNCTLARAEAAVAAVALMEAALDAAEQAVHEWEAVLPRSPDCFRALAAALRAVREGQ